MHLPSNFHSIKHHHKKRPPKNGYSNISTFARSICALLHCIQVDKTTKPLNLMLTHNKINCWELFSIFQNTVDKLVQRANASLLIGTSSWKEQFIDALTVSAGNVFVKCHSKRITNVTSMVTT